VSARYDRAKLRPGLALATALLAVGVAAALAGVAMGWVLGAFMLWSAAGLARRLLRGDPVLTIDDDGVHDHRIPVELPWADLESMRTVDRRALLRTVPFLELVPRGPLRRSRSSLLRAVLRGDVAVVDARNADRLMLDLQHLDRTPEEVMAAAREHRGLAGWR
jgi:hypothetical protein